MDLSPPRDILEEILNLPRTTRGRDAVTERQLRLVRAVPDRREQRRLDGIAR